MDAQKNNGTKYSTEKNKEELKIYKSLWEETKRQVEIITDDELIEYRKDLNQMIIWIWVKHLIVFT